MELGCIGRMIYAHLALFLSQSAGIMSDPFSVVLTALGTRSVRGTSLEASGDWALAFDGRARLKFVALMRGRCWLILPDHPPVALTEGDVFLLSNTRYTVASDPLIEPVDGMALYAPGQDLVRLGTGHDTVMIGGGSGFEEGTASFVLDALPSFLRVDRASAKAEAIARTLTSLQTEASQGELGSSIIAERLAEILVVEAVRAYVATVPSDRVGWITALADPRIGMALTMMHRAPARRWTVPELAAEVGMSRSAFAQRFSASVGNPPLDYLISWRMVLAQRKLKVGQAIATIAEEVGYSSQSAFAHAFKRTTGLTPRSGR